MEGDGLKPMKPWGPSKRTIWAGERDPKTGYLPVHIPNNGPHNGGSFLSDLYEDWRQEKNPEQYAVGFGARMAEMPDSDGRHTCWRSGWNDADTELLEQARHLRCLEEGREDDFPGTRRLLFHAGRLARENGVAFDQARTEPWKEGWIAADIQIGAEPAF